MNLKRISTLLAIMPTCVAANSQQAANDTLTGRISEVTIMSWRKHDKDLLPAQTLSGKQLESLSAQSVADAIRFFSGVQIKDYGGIGGLKYNPQIQFFPKSETKRPKIALSHKTKRSENRKRTTPKMQPEKVAFLVSTNRLRQALK